jgi:hypothetical protein
MLLVVLLFACKEFTGFRSMQLDSKITKKQLKEALSVDVDRLLDDVVEAMNKAKPGSIIDDSEEPVRDAAGQFRRMLFEKALELRGQSEAFPPSGQSGQSDGVLEE